ncbi:MAG: TPM domain-containing protein [Sphingobacteriales bacterium]|nr:TPM domain-containing protein [Sphingobacteriales bacterium]
MKKVSYILLLFVLSFFAAFSQQGKAFSIQDVIKNRPSPQKLVNDYANVLTPDQKQALETKLYQFDDSTSTQITVVLVPTVNGIDIADAAVELGRSWGIGQKGSNNGVVLLIAVQDRKLNISPGYGLEGALPDLTCQQIIQQIIAPNFKGNDYYRGIDEGTTAIIEATQGAFTAPEGYHKGSKLGGGKVLLIIIIIILFLVFSSRGGGGGSGFLTGMLLGNALGSGSRGGFGGGSSGGSFGGFGGGSFGGGGSSGSW